MSASPASSRWLADDVVGHLPDDGRGELHRAAEVRAAPRGNPVCVVRNVVEAVERHPEPFGDELLKTRLLALPRRHRPHHQLDPTLGQYRDRGALPRHARGNLDTVGDTDPVQLAAPLRRRAPAGKPSQSASASPVAIAAG
jgi:hypothetical protein